MARTNGIARAAGALAGTVVVTTTACSATAPRTCRTGVALSYMD
jgi:hypothetical protein